MENTKTILIFDKDAKVTQLGKDKLFQQIVSEQLNIQYKRFHRDLYLMPVANIILL